MREKAEEEKKKLQMTDEDKEEAERAKKEKERMHFANQIVNDNTLFLVLGLPNMDVLKLAQIKEYLPIQKQAWNKIINMKQGENIPH